MMHEDLGEFLAKQWKPGHTITGTLVRDGKHFQVTIKADGSTEEREEKTAARGNYRSVSSTDSNGHTEYSVSPSLIYRRSPHLARAGY